MPSVSAVGTSEQSSEEQKLSPYSIPWTRRKSKCIGRFETQMWRYKVGNCNHFHALFSLDKLVGKDSMAHSGFVFVFGSTPWRQKPQRTFWTLKRMRRVSVAGCLPNVCEALGFTPSMTENSPPNTCTWEQLQRLKILGCEMKGISWNIGSFLGSSGAVLLKRSKGRQ